MTKYYITGFPGSDKKSAAFRLRDKTGYPVKDLDKLIEEKEGMSIKRICMTMGEHQYRNCEYDLLLSLEKTNNLILICGDGIIHDPDNLDILKKGQVIIADEAAPPDTLWKRARLDRTLPHAFMQDPDETVKKKLFFDLYQARMPVYRNLACKEDEDMIMDSERAVKKAVYDCAHAMAAAALTAPKGCGADKIRVTILDGEEKNRLTAEMRIICEETGEDYFSRDAKNIDCSINILLIGAVKEPLGLTNCGFCGFNDCGACVSANGRCAFNVTDLGIAVGSAVSMAADRRIDNRIMFSAGKAALRLGFFPDDVDICYGIPLSVSSKSIYYDREA